MLPSDPNMMMNMDPAMMLAMHPDGFVHVRMRSSATRMHFVLLCAQMCTLDVDF